MIGMLDRERLEDVAEADGLEALGQMVHLELARMRAREASEAIGLEAAVTALNAGVFGPPEDHQDDLLELVRFRAAEYGCTVEGLWAAAGTWIAGTE